MLKKPSGLVLFLAKKKAPTQASEEKFFQKNALDEELE